MARTTKARSSLKKRKGQVYWDAVARAQGRKPKKAKSTLVASCTRKGIGQEECQDLVTSGLKGRRKSRKSGKPWGRRLSQTKAAKAARAGFKAAMKKCKNKKNVQSCMSREAPKEIAKRQ